MRIERLRIPGFGRLQGTTAFDPGRCSLIVAPNEAGKSTLVAALVAALYGFPSERRSKHNPIPDRDAFLPWNGDAFAVEVDFRLGGDAYSILRDFQADRVEIREGRTGKDVSPRFRGEGGRAEILEQLLGLERDDFERSALVGQDEIQVIRDGGDITLRLQKFATSRGSDITAGEALECLEESLRRYPGTQLAAPGKVDTEIQRLDEQLQEVRGRRERLQGEHDAAGADLAELDGLADRARELSVRLHRLDYLRTSAILSEIDAAIAEQERAVEEHRALRDELDRLAHLEGFPVEARNELSELKGKSEELTARIAEVRAEQEEEGPLQEVVERLGDLESVTLLTPEDMERVETLLVQIQDRREQLQSARKKARKQRKELRRQGIDVEESTRLENRFRDLEADDAEFLREHRERVLEVEARRREILDQAVSGPTSPGRPGTFWIAPAGGLGALGGALLWGLGGQRIPGVALLGAGLAVAVFGLLWARRESPAEEPSAARSLAAESEALRERLENLANRLRYDDGEELLAGFRRLEEIRREAVGLGEQEEETSRLEEELSTILQEAAGLLERAGRQIPPVQVRPRDLERLRDDFREAEQLRGRRADLDERSARDASTRSELEERLEAAGDRMRRILADAGILPDEAGGDQGRAAPPGENVLRRFEEAADAAERRRSVAEELLPAAAARLAAPEWLQAKREERRTMQEVLEEILRRKRLDPPPDPTRTSNHYVLEFKQTDEALRAVQGRRRQIFGQVGDGLRRYREEMPTLIAQEADLEAARDRADRFRRAVRLAADRLEEISRESYEEWATALNARANRILVHLNPAYRDLRFDTDLSFTLEEVATGRRLERDEVDAHLSAGARDQIYLAIRLAICDYFSAGRYRLPLILDDPFTAADDERFDRAMVFLAERISTRHQVILLSCQEERHRRFRERHRDLFDARIAEVRLPGRTEKAAQ